MKAISLWQPWASLITAGLKTVETRAWPLPRDLIGATIAIHAAQRAVVWDGLPVELRRYMESRLGVGAAQVFVDQCPLGAVVGHATLLGAWHVTVRTQDAALGYPLLGGPPIKFAIDPTGDFSEGRWLWGLGGAVAYEVAIPARGHQRIWNWAAPFEGTL